jgi:hypothetical protein
MNAGLESATALQSSSDIIAFRAARNIAERRNGGKPVDYVDAQMVLEEGMTAELFKEIMPLVEKAEGRGRNGMFEQIRDIFGMSRYKNANVLYEAWTNPEIRAKLDDKSLQAIIDNNKNELPSADSPELKAAITIEEIKNWWTETGISHWDANFPNTLLEELRKAKEEYNKATGGLPTKEPVDTSGMSPVEAARVRQQEYIDALDSGDPAWADRAYVALEKANMEALSPKPFTDPIDEETRARGVVGSQTGKMFDEFFGGREDKEAHKNVNSVFESAISSKDTGEREAAIRFANIIGSMKETERGSIDRYNKNDTWNELSKEVDIYGLIRALDRLTSKMEDVNVTFTEE